MPYLLFDPRTVSWQLNMSNVKDASIARLAEFFGINGEQNENGFVAFQSYLEMLDTIFNESSSVINLCQIKTVYNPPYSII